MIDESNKLEATLEKIERYILSSNKSVSEHSIINNYSQEESYNENHVDEALEFGISNGRLFRFYSRGSHKQSVTPETTYFGVINKKG